MEKKCILLSISQLKRALPVKEVNYGAWDCWKDSLPTEQEDRKTRRTQEEHKKNTRRIVAVIASLCSTAV